MREQHKQQEFLLDNIYLAHIDGQEVQKGKVNVVLDVKKHTHSFEFTFHTSGIVFVPCDRCLDEMEIPVESEDKLTVKFGREYAEEGENLIVIPEEEGEINVAWFMYEFIALTVPMKHVHGPGKCNKSMTSKLSKHLRTTVDEPAEDGFEGNDEEAEAEGGEQAIDPRWNELKKILDNN